MLIVIEIVVADIRDLRVMKSMNFSVAMRWLFGLLRLGSGGYGRDNLMLEHLKELLLDKDKGRHSVNETDNTSQWRQISQRKALFLSEE